MPRKPRVPQYRLHKASGQARVIVDGKHLYLGPYGAPESQAAYARLLAERFSFAAVDPAPSSARRCPDLTINELLVRYFDFAATYYVHEGQLTKDKLHEHVQTLMGWPNSHLHHFRIGEQLYGDPMLMEENMEELDYKDSTRTKIRQILPKNGRPFGQVRCQAGD